MQIRKIYLLHVMVNLLSEAVYLLMQDDLMILEQNPSCHSVPGCLCDEYIGEDGLWDPEKWHQSFSDSSSSFSSRLGKIVFLCFDGSAINAIN